MVTTVEMTNGKIYDLASSLISCMEGEMSLPVKVNFYLQKNMNKMIELGKEVETARMGILDKYGTLDEESNQYTFDDENAKKATDELKELMDLKQEVDIHMIDLDAFGDTELTNKQMASISFMIEE